MGISFTSSSSKGKGFYTNAGGFSAEIDGNDLIKALRQFPKNIQKNVMVGATRAAANVVRDRARELVPKNTGNLKKSIVSIQRNGDKLKFNQFSMAQSDQNKITFSVTPSKGHPNDGWYAHFVEFGTSHSSAKPFLRPAFDQSNNESLEASKKYIAERIPQELAKAKQWQKVKYIYY